MRSLFKPNMTDCIVRNVKFVRTNLYLTNMTGCVLEVVGFSDAVLSGAIFHGAIFTNTILGNADLSGADLIGAMFDNVDLTKAKMGDAKLPIGLHKLSKTIQQIITHTANGS